MDRNTDATRGWSTQAGAQNGENASAESMTEVASDAKQALAGTAQETVDTAKNATKEIADTAQEQIAQTVDQAVTQTADTVSQVKEQANSVFVDQRDRAVSSLTGLADALRETGKTLANQSDSASDGSAAPAAAIGPFIEDLADRLASSSDYLKDKDVSQLVHDAEDLARRQPLLFAGALFGIGVVGARLLKGTLGTEDTNPSSSATSETQRDWSTGTGWGADQASSQNQRTGFADSMTTTQSADSPLGQSDWTDEGSSGFGVAPVNTIGDPS